MILLFSARVLNFLHPGNLLSLELSGLVLQLQDLVVAEAIFLGFWVLSLRFKRCEPQLLMVCHLGSCFWTGRTGRKVRTLLLQPTRSKCFFFWIHHRFLPPFLEESRRDRVLKLQKSCNMQNILLKWAFLAFSIQSLHHPLYLQSSAWIQSLTVVFVVVIASFPDPRRSSKGRLAKEMSKQKRFHSKSCKFFPWYF